MEQRECIRLSNTRGKSLSVWNWLSNAAYSYSPLRVVTAPVAVTTRRRPLEQQYYGGEADQALATGARKRQGLLMTK